MAISKYHKFFLTIIPLFTTLSFSGEILTSRYSADSARVFFKNFRIGSDNKIVLENFRNMLKLDTIKEPKHRVNYIENELPKRLAFVDIDRDGDLDVIHQDYFFPDGRGAIEIPLVSVYIRENDIIRKIHSTSGYIVSTSKPSFSSPLDLTVYSHGCCGDERQFYSFYQGVRDSAGFSYKLFLKLIQPMGVEKPTDLLSNPIKFATINEQYNLRRIPSVRKAGDGDLPTVIATYPKGTRGTAIAQKVDSTGKSWWYVYIRSKKDPNKYPEYRDAHVLGWMSSRYLRRFD